MKKTLPFFLLLSIFIILPVFLINIQLTEAAVGDIKVTVTREGDSAAIEGATVEVLCLGGDYNQLTGDPTTDASGIVQALPVGGSSCDDTDSIDVRVSKDGYVTKTDAGIGTYAAASDPSETITVTNVQFAYKITSITTQVLDTDITGSVAPLTVGNATGEDTCTLSGGSWYCPVVLANSSGDLLSTPTLDGYVQKNYDLFTGWSRGANTDPQRSDTIINIEYSHKVTGQDELTSSLTSATITVGGTGCTESTGVYYCPTPVASDGETDDVIVTKNGYVTWNADSTNRTANTGVQATYTSVNQFAYKITSIATQVLSTDITASVTTLTVGDDTAKNTCTSSSNVWYCPVVLLNSNGTMVGNVTLDGYVQKNYNLFTGATRTDNTHPQRSDTITGVEYAVKITVLSGATVTTGDSYGTTCTEGSNYYCAVPLADTETNVQVVKTGYDTKTELNAWTDRTSDTDAQATCSLSLVAETIPYSRPPGSRRIKEKPIIGMTIEELKTKIAEISAKISQLRAQLQQLSGGEILEVLLEIPADYRLTVNLEYGQKGDDVGYLQVFLKVQGLEIYPEGLVTGYFGPLTQAAVIRFQEKYRDDILAPWEITEGTGFVGKTTRVKLNELLAR